VIYTNLGPRSGSLSTGSLTFYASGRGGEASLGFCYRGEITRTRANQSQPAPEQPNCVNLSVLCTIQYCTALYAVRWETKDTKYAAATTAAPFSKSHVSLLREWLLMAAISFCEVGILRTVTIRHWQLSQPLEGPAPFSSSFSAPMLLTSDHH
jgi:hypothetical protein